MPRKVINIRYEGEETDILTAIEALAYYGKYDSAGELTKEEVAQNYLSNFIRARVKTYAQMVATQADREALKAKELAITQATDTALDDIVKLPLEITNATVA
jgi:hypothetical protein